MNALDDESDGAIPADGHLPLGITPYYASLLDPDDPCRACAGRGSGAPRYHTAPGEADDPLGEDHTARCRVWCTATPTGCCFWSPAFCAAYCRYCTRSRWSARRSLAADSGKWERRAANISAARRPRRAVLRRRPADSGRREARLDAGAIACDPARRVPPHRHQDADGAAAAHHPGAVPHAARVPPAVG